MKATSPTIIFFTTFFALSLVIFGLLGLLIFGWCIYRRCRFGINASSQEASPMTAEKNKVRRVLVQTRPKYTSTTGKAPSTVTIIIDAGMAGIPTMESMNPKEPKIYPRTTCHEQIKREAEVSTGKVGPRV